MQMSGIGSGPLIHASLTPSLAGRSQSSAATSDLLPGMGSNRH